MAIFIVNRTDDVTADDGQLTLREAIALANATAEADEIQFDPTVFTGPQTITLGGSELAIDRDLTITGTGQSDLVIDGNNGSRVFLISNTNDANVTLTNLTIQGGRATAVSFGAGIRNDSGGELTLDTVLITGNDGSGGSGIFNSSTTGTLTVTNSSISNNSGSAGINNSGTLTITNSTVSGNNAGNGSGGGIASNSNSVVTITNSTISGNTSRYGGGLNLSNGATISNSTITGNMTTGVTNGGGGIRNQAPFMGTVSPVIISNSIIAGNLNNGSGLGPDVLGDGINSGGNNILGTADDNGNGSIGTGTGDTILANQMPAPSIGDVLNTTLADNGGPTQTHALVTGSLAIDNGGPGATTQDQRGAIATGGRDIGAFEFIATPDINVLGNGLAIASMDTTPSLGDNTDFGSTPENGGTVVSAFTIQNLGQGNLTLSGVPTISGDHAGDFDVTLDPTTAVSGLDSTSFQVTFDPSASGVRRAVVNINSDDPDTNNYTFSIQGTGLAPAEINVTGNAVAIMSGAMSPAIADGTDFGGVSASSGTIAQTFTIENTGDLDLSLTGNPVVSLSGTDAGDFTITQPSNSVIAGGNSTTFQIEFDPSVVGDRTATVTILNDDTDEGSYTFDIQGEGLPDLPEIDITGNAMVIMSGDTTPDASDDTDFGEVLASSGTITKTFTIQNTGSADLSLTGMSPVSVGGTNATDFTITQPTDLTVGAGNSTTFDVTFDPSEVGDRTATLTIASDDTDEGTYTFAITGQGTADTTPPPPAPSPDPATGSDDATGNDADNASSNAGNDGATGNGTDGTDGTGAGNTDAGPDAGTDAGTGTATPETATDIEPSMDTNGGLIFQLEQLIATQVTSFDLQLGSGNTFSFGATSNVIEQILNFFALLPDSDASEFNFNFSQLSFSASFSLNLQTTGFGGAVNVDLPTSNQTANVQVGGFRANSGYRFSGQGFSGDLNIEVPGDTAETDGMTRRVFSFSQFQASARIQFSASAIALPFDIDSELPLNGFLGAGGDIVELVGDVVPEGAPTLFGLGGGGDFFADLRSTFSDLFLNGNGGDDDITGGGGNDTVNGGADDDRVDGGAGDDQVSGDRGNDSVDGGDGNDTVSGGDGDDVVMGGDGDDLVECGAGDDIGLGGMGNDTVDGGMGNDTVNGNQGSDDVMGGMGDDVVNGGMGDDMLMGGDGDDVLSGDMGDDMLMGGAGSDRFDYGVGRGIDTILDFDPLLDQLGINGVDLDFAQLEIREVQIGVQINTEIIVAGDEGSRIILQNTFAAQISQSTFTFFGAASS